jgi:ATP-dependent DNA helicase DinG
MSKNNNYEKYMQNLQHIFSAGGILDQKIDSYNYRKEQWQLAQEISKTIVDGGILVAQAGTGTGKTFAYLVPAILFGGKVILSTASKTLQDQLFRKDLPLILKTLGIPAQISLLKGRNNYICKNYLEHTLENGTVQSPQEVVWLNKIDKFSKISKTGDKNDCVGVPENEAIWSQVTANKDTCLGNQCQYYNECFMVQARKDALTADIVVVNHHLFIADLMLKQADIDIEILPKSHAVIFDEAHHLPKIATNFFGTNVSTMQITDLCSNLRLVGTIHCPDTDYNNASNQVEKAAKDLRLTLEQGKYQYKDINSESPFWSGVNVLFYHLQEMGKILQNNAARHEEIAKMFDNYNLIIDAFSQWIDTTDNHVYWIDVNGANLTLHVTPLDIAEKFSSYQQQAWIFTSATLAVDKDFSHFVRELGLNLPKKIIADGDDSNINKNNIASKELAIASHNENLKTLYIESPFDYKKSLIYVPNNLPAVSDKNYNTELIRNIWPIILASGGHAFILCTTLRALEQSHIALQEILNQHGLNWPVLVQGNGSRLQLLEKFKISPNAILIGSQSFWEGVDVPGKALQLVIIDKLPFATPDEPINAGKIKYLTDQGLNAFNVYQVPHAAILLQQGIGRLIRSEKDKGVVVIGDRRIIDKYYGKVLLKSLPSFTLSTNENNAINFFS